MRIEDCELCEGRKTIPCDECEGRGHMYEDGINYDLEGGEPDICDQCGGNGEIECPECTGR